MDEFPESFVTYNEIIDSRYPQTIILDELEEVETGEGINWNSCDPLIVDKLFNFAYEVLTLLNLNAFAMSVVYSYFFDMTTGEFYTFVIQPLSQVTEHGGDILFRINKKTPDESERDDPMFSLILSRSKQKEAYSLMVMDEPDEGMPLNPDGLLFFNNALAWFQTGNNIDTFYNADVVLLDV